MFAELKEALSCNWMLICGLGLCLAWFYSAFFSCSLVSVSYLDSVNGSDTYWSIAVLTTAISAALTLRSNYLKSSGGAVWLCALFCALGVLIIRFGYYSEQFHVFFYSVGASTAGLGFGSLAMRWVDALGRCSSEAIELVVPSAFLVSFAFYFLVFALKNSAAVWFMCSFVVASAAMMRKMQLKKEEPKRVCGTTSESGVGERVSVFADENEGNHPFRQFVLFAVLWFGFGLLRVFTSPGFYEDRTVYYCVPFSVGLILSTIIVICTIRFSRSIDLATILKWALVLYPLGYATDYLFGGGNFGGLVGYAVGCVAMIVMQICVFIVLPKAASHSGGDACANMVPYLVGEGLGAFLGVAAGKVLMGIYGYAWPFEVVLLSICVLTGVGVATMPFRYHLLRVRDTPRVSTEQKQDESAVDPFDSFAESYQLSPREKEVNRLLAQGYSRLRIRDELFISLNTVSTHVKSIYTKVGVHSQSELIVALREFSDNKETD